MWSVIHLDSDPAHPDYWSTTVDSWVQPTYVERFLLLSAFPAFVLAKLGVMLLDRLDINEIVSFMVFAPVLTCIWYYFIGWLLDRWICRRAQSRVPAPDLR